MEVAGHLLFMFFKILVLASVYSLMIVAILTILSRFNDAEYLKKVTKNKKSAWFVYGFVISILLFIYSFTYWGNHGLGDGPRIPVGYWNVVENTNWQFSNLRGYTDFEGNKICVSRFTTENNYFCGEFDQDHFFYDFKNEYFVINMKTNEIIEFMDKNEYNRYAQMNKLPLTSNLFTFEQNYHNYFRGWRFWLLP